MLCPKCHHDNDIKDKFCSYCGTSLMEEQRIERLKEQSRQVAASGQRIGHRSSPALFSSGLIGFFGWMAFFIGMASLLFGIGMLFQRSTTPAVSAMLQLPPMAVVGEHIPTNFELFVNDLTAPIVLRWALWSIFAGMVMIACGDGLKLLTDLQERLNR
jgi:hypothetical protein